MQIIWTGSNFLCYNLVRKFLPAIVRLREAATLAWGSLCTSASPPWQRRPCCTESQCCRCRRPSLACVESTEQSNALVQHPCIFKTRLIVTEGTKVFEAYSLKVFESFEYYSNLFSHSKGAGWWWLLLMLGRRLYVVAWKIEEVLTCIQIQRLIQSNIFVYICDLGRWRGS